MKFTATIASALAVSALLAPSVLAEDTAPAGTAPPADANKAAEAAADATKAAEATADKAKDAAASAKDAAVAAANATAVNTTGLPAPSSAAILEFYKKKDTFPKSAIHGLTYRQTNKTAIDEIDPDYFNYKKSYPGLPADQYALVQKALLCELVKPGSVEFDGAAIKNSDKFNDILLTASLVGEHKKAESTLASKVPADPADDAGKKAAKETKEFLDHFCYALTYKRNQFFVANTSHFLATTVEDKAGVDAQNDVLLTTLDLCKAHFSDARTLAASVGATVAATAVFLAAFL